MHFMKPRQKALSDVRKLDSGSGYTDYARGVHDWSVRRSSEKIDRITADMDETDCCESKQIGKVYETRGDKEGKSKRVNKIHLSRAWEGFVAEL